MIYVLDVNVLLALAWPTHVDHSAAQSWFRRLGRKGWATCPLTELGFVRISSAPQFTDAAVTPTQASDALHQASSIGAHHFWTAELSVSLDVVIDRIVQGHRQVTDAYLLALTRKQSGKFATFDGRSASLLPTRQLRKRYIEFLG